MFTITLIDYIADGDFHLKMECVDFSTSIREIVTVEYMMNNPVD